MSKELETTQVLIEGHLYSDVGLPERLAADGSMRQFGNTAWQSTNVRYLGLSNQPDQDTTRESSTNMSHPEFLKG